MVTLKLVKARSYNGTVKATHDKPYVTVETEDEAKYLVATGYFEVSATSTDKTPDKKDDGDAETEPDYDALSEMTKSELEAYAADNGIDISKCKTKADILEVISVAFGGSSTMIDLQK